MDVKDKTIFITGGADGIGLATAKKLLFEGANVVIYSLDVDKVKNENLDSDKVLILKGNVRFRNQVKKAMKKAIKKFGSVDVLINNAGVAKRENFLETDNNDWDFIFDVNVKGVFICTQEFIKNQQLTTNDQQQNKLIINIASGVGIYGSAGLAVYSASKAAVINISQSLNDELKDENVKLVAVCPGSTDTKMYQELFPSKSAHHTPEQVAEVIYKTIIGEIKPDDRLIIDVFQHTR
ncbi:MAG: SDR family oxidoreductase [Patescibacteria group bacterium]